MTEDEQSIIVTALAPLEAASNPKDPLPANKSRHLIPFIAGESQLNSVSRTRSGVGRSPLVEANRICRLRHWPPIIRIFPADFLFAFGVNVILDLLFLFYGIQLQYTPFKIHTVLSKLQ
jgi:hypothetical protein